MVRAASAGPAGNRWASSDALAVFFADGTYRYGLPPRGLPSDLDRDRAELPSRWGTWAEVEGTVEVTRGGSVESRFVREGDDLVGEAGAAWSLVTGFAAGTRLDGSFARGDFREAGAPRISFAPDGRFTASGPVLSMVGSLFNVVTAAGEPFEPGTGNYSLEDFRLSLHLDDGRELAYAVIPVADAGMFIGESQMVRD